MRMPRPPRIHVDGGFYHVILRGNHQEPIFFVPSDRHRLAEIVGEVIERCGMRVHAYCWMTNHIHLLMQVGDVPLGRAMMRIAGRYAREVQRRRPTTGHLFERRHRAILVDADSYMLELVRYIHLNPVRAGVVTDPQDYVWSSHRAYLGKSPSGWLTTQFALDMFHRDRTRARRAYRRFVLDGVSRRVDNGLAMGRSDEPRVLGSDRFLERVKERRLPRSVRTLDSMIDVLCRRHGVDAAELSTPGRRRDLARLRAMLAYHAVTLRIATLSDLARRFGRNVSTLCESVEYHRRVHPGLFREPLDP